MYCVKLIINWHTFSPTSPPQTTPSSRRPSTSTALASVPSRFDVLHFIRRILFHLFKKSFGRTQVLKCRPSHCKWLKAIWYLHGDVTFSRCSSKDNDLRRLVIVVVVSIFWPQQLNPRFRWPLWRCQGMATRLTPFLTKSSPKPWSPSKTFNRRWWWWWLWPLTNYLTPPTMTYLSCNWLLSWSCRSICIWCSYFFKLLIDQFIGLHIQMSGQGSEQEVDCQRFALPSSPLWSSFAQTARRTRLRQILEWASASHFRDCSK